MVELEVELKVEVAGVEVAVPLSLPIWPILIPEISENFTEICCCSWWWWIQKIVNYIVIVIVVFDLLINFVNVASGNCAANKNKHASTFIDIDIEIGIGNGLDKYRHTHSHTHTHIWDHVSPFVFFLFFALRQQLKVFFTFLFAHFVWCGLLERIAGSRGGRTAVPVKCCPGDRWVVRQLRRVSGSALWCRHYWEMSENANIEIPRGMFQQPDWFCI